MAGTPTYRPLDVVRCDALPCEVLADAIADIEAGAPRLRAGWLGVTKDGDRCDLPYGQIPRPGAFWYTRLGLTLGYRGTDLPAAERAEALDWLESWAERGCR